jgi:hypothetical protein
MANRDNHYERAFEEFLQSRGVPYVAVDEARRAHWGSSSLKSLDFIVSPADSGAWLVDVKGRKFPSGEQRQYWKNWSTRDDLVSLAGWQRLFGQRFRGLFVFAYSVVGDRTPLAAERMFAHRGRLYGFVGVALADYSAHARPISPRWDTVAMPTGVFRRCAAPVDELLGLVPTPPAPYRHEMVA